jgi:hypothetical protein
MMRNVGLCIRWAELNGVEMSESRHARDQTAGLWFWFLVPARDGPGPGPGPGPSPDRGLGPE